MNCKKCDKEVKGGGYNTPNGFFCPDCWESKVKPKIPKKQLRQMENAALNADIRDKLMKILNE